MTPPNFKPCSPDCPAVTGKPKGSVRFCPALERDRHRQSLPDGAGREVRKVRGQWVEIDWRDGTEKPVDFLDVDGEMVEFLHTVPFHPDYTDCCADFRCCSDVWDREGLGSMRDALTAAPTPHAPSPPSSNREED